MYKKQGKLEITGFCDSDYGGCVDTRRSTSGYVFMISRGAVTWSSKRQGCVAMSSCEAEYMAGSHAGKEGVWLRNFLNEMGFNVHVAISIYRQRIGNRINEKPEISFANETYRYP